MPADNVWTRNSREETTQACFSGCRPMEWLHRSRNEGHKQKGLAILDALLNDTMLLGAKKFIMGGLHSTPYPPNTIACLLGMELDGRTEIEARAFIENCVEPIVDHRPRGDFALTLDHSFPFSSRLMKHVLPQIGGRRGILPFNMDPTARREQSLISRSTRLESEDMSMKSAPRRHCGSFGPPRNEISQS